MHYESNIDELAAGTRPGIVRMDGPSAIGGGTVGARLAESASARVFAQAARGVDPDGRRWDDNAPSTIAAKGANKPNVRTGDMLSREAIDGAVTARADEVEILYGTGKRDDKGATDRDKAYRAETGQSAHGIVRGFWALGGADMDGLAEMAADEWDAAAGGR